MGVPSLPAPSAPPAEALQPPPLPQAIAVPLAVQAEPQAGLPFYQRKCFVISMTLLAVGAVLGVVLSNSLGGNTGGPKASSGDTPVPVPGLGGVAPQTSSPSEDPVAGQSAMNSLAPSSSVVPRPKTKPTSNPNINPVTLPTTMSNIPVYLPTWPPVLTMNSSLKLLASEGAADDWFGCSTAIYQDTIVVGAEKDDDNGLNSGSAHVFVRSGGGWMHQAKLLAPDGSEEGRFGMGVAIHEDTIVVGAWGEDDNGSSSGSAHVFVRYGADWTHQAKLLAPDGAAMDYFGRSVAIQEDTIVVGAFGDDDNGPISGSAHVFVRKGGRWNHQAKLLAPDGDEGDRFGMGVAIHEDTIVAGAFGDDDKGSGSGSAHVFVRYGADWTHLAADCTHQAKLLAPDGSAMDYFGRSVAINEDTIVVGAERDDDNGEDRGSAHVFVRAEEEWKHQAKLLAPDGGTDMFGANVAVDGVSIVVAAYRDDNDGSVNGSAHVFVRSLGKWTHRAKLLAPDGAAGDWFGRSVAIHENTIVVGANRDDDNGEDSGSAYVFLA